MPDITKAAFGEHRQQPVYKIDVRFPKQLSATLMTYGATLMSLSVPDKAGSLQDIVLGYDALHHYQRDDRHFGATVGRFANRIAQGRFTLKGETYSLPINNGPNHLHGGPAGFAHSVWDIADIKEKEEEAHITLTLESPDGDQGYPGTLHTQVTYVFRPDGFALHYQARSEKTTVINLTHHSYFNLSGDTSKPITDHLLWADASRYIPLDDTGIPNRGLASVEGTPFDFTELKRVGERILDPALEASNGYDHCLVLDAPNLTKPSARVIHPGSGRKMEVYTTEPGIQFFTGNFAAKEKLYEGGRHFERYAGLCLETQHFPDSPNQPDFPSTTLEAGKIFRSKTVYRFSLAD